MSRWSSAAPSPSSAGGSETPRSELEPCLPHRAAHHRRHRARGMESSHPWHWRVPILRLLHRSLFWRIYLHALTLLVVVALSVALTLSLLGQRPQWVDIPRRAAEHLGEVWPEALKPHSGSSEISAASAPTPFGSPASSGVSDAVTVPSSPLPSASETVVERGQGAGEGEARPLPYTVSQLQNELRVMSHLSGVDLTLYTHTGVLILSSVEPPLPFQVQSELGPPQVSGGVLSHHPRGRMRVLPVFSEGRLVGQLLFAWPQAFVDLLTRALGVLLAVLLALALGSLPLARGMVAPLRRLAESARALGEGQLSTRTGLQRGDEVGEVAYAFDDMAERLERLILSEKELLANISHELRTPLARIRFALELAHDGNPEEAQRYLGEVGTDVAELERLVEDVLTAARLDHAQARGQGIPLRRASVSVNEWLEQTAQRFEAQHPGLHLRVQPLVEDVSVEGDAMLLRRVLDNLLENAYKYADPSGPIELMASLKRPSAMSEHAEPEGDQRKSAPAQAGAAQAGTAQAGAAQVSGVWLAVRDRGPGIAPDELPLLFTPFFRTEKSRSRGGGGVGLGLTLVKRVVEAHQGIVEVESELSHGTCFYVWIPTL
ncbi:MAG: sensor histidine kinase [Myxococcota bacterium]